MPRMAEDSFCQPELLWRGPDPVVTAPMPEDGLPGASRQVRLFLPYLSSPGAKAQTVSKKSNQGVFVTAQEGPLKNRLFHPSLPLPRPMDMNYRGGRWEGGGGWDGVE